MDIDKEPIIEPIGLSTGIEYTWATVSAAVFAVIIVYVLLILRSRRKQKNTFLIVGLSDSGKTLIFSKLINKDVNQTTYTSIK
uniref:Signal recognition particle receptor subunit beta n=1 Tax=Panagrolaimus davidi TaxID=227884 RepID=A0A914PG86_9BILA